MGEDDQAAAIVRDDEKSAGESVFGESKRVRFELEEVRRGLAEAKAGEFATEDEVCAVFGKYDLK